MEFIMPMGRPFSPTASISACVSVAQSDVPQYSHQDQQELLAPGAQAERSQDNPSVAWNSTSNFSQPTTDSCQVSLATLVNFSVHESFCTQCPWLQQPGRQCTGTCPVLAQGFCHLPLLLSGHRLISLSLMNVKSKKAFGFFTRELARASFWRCLLLNGSTQLGMLLDSHFAAWELPHFILLCGVRQSWFSQIQ